MIGSQGHCKIENGVGAAIALWHYLYHIDQRRTSAGFLFATLARVEAQMVLAYQRAQASSPPENRAPGRRPSRCQPRLPKDGRMRERSARGSQPPEFNRNCYVHSSDVPTAPIRTFGEAFRIEIQIDDEPSSDGRQVCLGSMCSSSYRSA